jgi:4-amino-4-deoxy-L-arabinose transferase-like glycosyltransferase
MIDVTLTFFVTLALFALVLAIRRDTRCFLLWGLAISVSILLKSILGFFPLLITIVFLLTTGRWSLFLNPWFLIGSVLIVTLGCSWYVHQYLTFGSAFLDLHFKWLIIHRGFQLDPEPWYAHLSYFRDLLRHYWPWVPVFAWSLTQFIPRAFRRDENALILTCWVLLYLGVMSLTQSRILWYVMPIFAATAIMCGQTLHGWLGEQRRVKTARWVFVGGMVAALILNLTPLRVSSVREQDIRTLAPYVKHLAAQGVGLTGFGYTFHALNNPLLFYSDNAARTLYKDYSELAARFTDSTSQMCIVGPGQLDSVLSHAPHAHVLRKTGGAALIATRPFDVADVVTW